MLFDIFRILFVVFVFAMCLAGCVRKEYVSVAVCPYGVPVLTQSDYETLSDESKISDGFITWVVANGEYCEKVGALK